MVKRTERLQGSKQKRDDEYYTLFNDIAAEVSLYLPQLRGKRILCPCDWDESYNEEIVYKEEGYMLERDLFSQEGSIKNYYAGHVIAGWETGSEVPKLDNSDEKWMGRQVLFLFKCVNSPWHPSNTSLQVASKSPVYQGSATSPGRWV